MKKLFLKYFFSIFAISVLSLAIQNGLLLIQYSHSQSKWKEFVYYDFVDSVEKNLTDSSFPDFSIDSINLFSKALESESRVSGFLVRNQDGHVALLVGQSPEGVVFTSGSPKYAGISEMNNAVSIKTNNTILNIVFNGKSFEVRKTLDFGKKSDYFLPKGINANNIIGTVTIMYESQPLSSIDIIAHSPRTYQYSKDIINSCLKSITVAIPVCILISLVLSCIIGSNNAKYINSIRKALNELAKDGCNVKLKKNRNSELNEISIAVSELDEKLQANRKSRQAWLTGISHDLNTPATAMKMLLEGINDGLFEADSTTLEEIRTENDILCGRIQKIIEFATLQADTKPNPETVNCLELFSFVKSEFSSVVTDFQVKEIQCDRSLITKAVRELLANAENTQKEQNLNEQTEIKMSVSKDEKNYLIQITNRGSLPEGLDSSACFEPLTKGDYSRSSAGSGLGLAIVGIIAKLHKGKASIEENNGTVTASIILPLQYGGTFKTPQ